MNLSLPMHPIYLVDAVGSTLSLVVAAGCVMTSLKLVRMDRGNALWTYLFWISTAFATFTIFRSTAHLLKYLLIISGNKEVWKSISPITGSMATLAFMFVATLTFYYERVKQGYQSLMGERDHLEDAKEEITLLNENLLVEMNRIRESEWRLDAANHEISRLIDRVHSGGDLTVRYRNSELTPCWEFKDCVHDKCPAYKSEHLRCWHFGQLYCCNIRQNDKADNCSCETCEIYISAHKDPISRLGERFNDMMHILETNSRELQEANENLYEMDKRKSKFLDIVAHDLRTPLTSILSYADLLMRYKSEPEETKDEFLRTIIQESRRLGELINDYLDLSRIESGLFEYTYGPFDFREVIDHAVSVYAGICIKKGITISTDGLCDEMSLIGDKGRMIQVMSNLMSNASKFTPVNGKIEIRSNIESDGTELHIVVSDTGVGVPESHLKEIFKKFTQVHSGDMHTMGGTGIGLSICKEIMESHKGKIWAEKADLGGASFHLLLPVQGPAVSVEEADCCEKKCESTSPPPFLMNFIPFRLLHE